jgi:phosphoribosylformylglycinamidine cyclo-ligase
LNLTRIAASVGFQIENLPKPQPIFDLIQATGNVSAAEMYRVFNMGIGFCVVVPNDAEIVDLVQRSFVARGFETLVIGQVIEDGARRVFLREQKLIGEGDEFRQAA